MGRDFEKRYLRHLCSCILCCYICRGLLGVFSIRLFCFWVCLLLIAVDLLILALVSLIL